ncbi:hypothetical protein BKA70DRAFT_265853 [Coprinopsis sp. MPI-PUGE-AT-0042]|nr:hypothetical protein BKA70DRAFT_265853 [Coprinopsis sp. MPI-PUGE-AT-0042]
MRFRTRHISFSLSSSVNMRPTTILLLAPVLYAHAQLTIFLPGFDEQPLVADVAGTEGGRTTYFVHNTDANPDLPADGFFGTATVIQGPTDASIHYELATN